MAVKRIGVLMAVVTSVLLGAAAARADTASTGSRELSGRVVTSDGSTLFLEHMGAVIPIEYGRTTRFLGVASAAALAGGQEVRASFTVKGDTKNLANEISLVSRPPVRELPSWPDRSEAESGF